jgi:hypothetical protein
MTMWPLSSRQSGYHDNYNEVTMTTTAQILLPSQSIKVTTTIQPSSPLQSAMIATSGYHQPDDLPTITITIRQPSPLLYNAATISTKTRLPFPLKSGYQHHYNPATITPSRRLPSPVHPATSATPVKLSSPLQLSHHHRYHLTPSSHDPTFITISPNQSGNHRHQH